LSPKQSKAAYLIKGQANWADETVIEGQFALGTPAV
jgi:hypothetical protein